MKASRWEFWIDVGGTFTDCLARSLAGGVESLKVLSSGVTKGRVEQFVARDRIVDSSRMSEPDGFWVGYTFQLLDEAGGTSFAGKVTQSDRATGALTLDCLLPDDATGVSELAYELSSGEEAPILAIRRVLGLRLDEPIPRVSVRLGTTRGTNALLTRGGGRTAFVTTRGFADVLEIGYQDRPRLFDLAIEKPVPLYLQVIEVDERVAADGSVLTPLDEAGTRRQLVELKQTGVESLAICLMHACMNPTHEQFVEQIARDVGFAEVSASHAVSPVIKIVSRGDTTVLNAYLNPVLRAYVGSLRQALGESDLKVMTSSGGLVDAANFIGKDSILSGPAGGVIGFARVAQRAGFEKSIGFDMGGTSTDVARFDGIYERTFEKQLAGVRVAAPMLAIETVAAGGGSICEFDGVKLTVGPASAGAEPGPACYGRGGPLTVTDVNLFLGKIVPSRFPFPLDREAVRKKLASLCKTIAAAPDGAEYSPAELAEGFVKVAVANMARAIRNISVARGYDPQDHVLATFGGAGGQHACDIARSLGMKQILIHPYAGVLSAYGIGLADVRRFAEQAVLKLWTSNDTSELEELFEKLSAEAKADVLAQGTVESQLQPPVHSLDMRYRGAEATINVARPADGDYSAAFAARHRRLFGFVREGSKIEVAAARVEVVAVTAEPEDAVRSPVVRSATPAETTTAWFDGREQTTAVFFREQLQAGDQFEGPAIVCEPTSTIVAAPGFSAEVTARGEILMSDRRTTERERVSTAADPVMLEIFNNLFASIAEQMGTTLERTAFSTNVKERRDFSCAVFSAEGELVANAPHIPVHLGAMGEAVRCILADNPDIRAGDAFVTNDPFRGGSHLPDVTVVTPVHDAAEGELLFFTASRAHHAEIGGITPGSLPPFSRNLAEEGVLIQNFKLQSGGVSREEKLRELLLAGPYPTRSVDENLADTAAQLAANHQGATLLGELVAKYSLEVVRAYMRHIRQAASRKMRMALAALGDGVYERTDHLDDGSPISVKITIRGGEAVVDFNGTGPVVEGNLNANRSIVTAAVLYVFRCLIDEDIPLNDGVLEPIEIVLPQSLLCPPRDKDAAKCAAVVGGNVETSQRVVDTLLGALGAAAASQGTMNNLTFGDDAFGYYETICGGSGATAANDGAHAVHTHMTNTRLTDPEVIEHRYPVRLREFSIRRGSGGAGKRRGGDGVVRRIEFLRPLTVSLLTERRGPFAPFGLHGGKPGELGVNLLCRADESSEETLPAKVQFTVKAGDLLTLLTPGGGGYGVE